MLPAPTEDTAPLFLHPHPAPLVPLLVPHLPSALPLYSTLLTPGVDTPVWASFPPSDDGSAAPPPGDEPWFVLADMGNQLRFYCSAETSTSEEERARAEELILRSFRWYLTHHANGRPDIRIGAIPAVWTAAIARGFSAPFYPSHIHYQRLPPASSAPHDSSSATFFPEGITGGETLETHIEQILSTSDVPHPPSYLLTRLPHTTSLFSPSSSSPAEPKSELVAHCITHRDGSIGTVHVSPAFRQQGLGTLLLRERMRAMAASPSPLEGVGEAPRFAHCYVSPGNEKSRALMRRVGMDSTAWCVSWAVVQLPLKGGGEA
ncbi:hypothetical protein JCM10207_006498 [Rhodosporidiobolus poonsookiae]